MRSTRQLVDKTAPFLSVRTSVSTMRHACSVLAFAAEEFPREAKAQGITLNDDANATRRAPTVGKGRNGAAQSYSIQRDGAKLTVIGAGTPDPTHPELHRLLRRPKAAGGERKHTH